MDRQRLSTRRREVSSGRASIRERAILLRIVRSTPPRLAFSSLAALVSVASAASVVFGPSVAKSAPLTPLPGTQAAEVPRAPTTAASPAERLSRGVVTIERDGRVLSVGAVLSGDGDGRILTALSPFGASDLADVRYADGSVVHAKVGHRDRAWDLALLVPLAGKWVDGLVASGDSPVGEALQAPVALRPGRPVVVAARVRGVVDVRAKEGNGVLASVLDVELQGGAPNGPTVGAPLTDRSGGVVGVFVRACQATLPVVASAIPGAPPPVAAAPPCVPIVVAAPVAAIREFLSHTPISAVAPTPWLGIVGVTESGSTTRGVRVMAVAPESPAQKGGLKASNDPAQADLIVAVDGQPVDSPERLADLISRRAIGDHVKLLLLSGGKFREGAVVLRAAP